MTSDGASICEDVKHLIISAQGVDVVHPDGSVGEGGDVYSWWVPSWGDHKWVSGL